MVSSIQGTGMTAGINQIDPCNHTRMSKNRRSADILSQYDPENITDEDAKAIFQAFKDAGITAAKGMKRSDRGGRFDAEDLRSKGMPERRENVTATTPPQESSSSTGMNIPHCSRCRSYSINMTCRTIRGRSNELTPNKLQQWVFEHGGM